MRPAYEHGAWLFHYTTRKAAFEHILPTKRLRFSPYTEMRDPLENKWLFNSSYTVPTGMRDDDPNHPARAQSFLEARAAVIRESAKVLSLTLDAEGFEEAPLFGRGWARARMWEQYAENHAGVCLLFKRDALTKRVTESLRAQGLPGPYNRPVIYTQRGTGGGLRLNLDEIDRLDEQFVNELVEAHNDQLFFLKTTDWETEHEYRFVVTSPADHFVYADLGDDVLDAVIVGEHLPRWEWPGVIQSCEDAGAAALRLEWSTGSPRAWWLTEPPPPGGPLSSS
jgi:hypothetical protein